MIILSITSVILGMAVAYYVAETAIMRQIIHDQDWTIERLSDEIEELREIRCEYERSLGGTSYQWRPVNRISQRFPK